MSIDVAREHLVSLSQLAKRIPPSRQGRPVHVSTIHRWRMRGVRGIKLDAVRVGGVWLTSDEAFARFCSELTASHASVVEQISPQRGDADQSLEREGW